MRSPHDIRRYALLAVLAAPIACSNNDGTPNGGSGGPTVGPGSDESVCPSSPPDEGAGCEEPWASTGSSAGVIAHCSWGDDPRAHCRTTATCNAGSWVVTSPTDARCDDSPLGDACPEPLPTAGSECSDTSIDCWYASGEHCFCSPCQGGSQYPICLEIDPPQWACIQRPEQCPAQLPQAGASCDTEDANCGPDCELQVVCQGGVWQWNHGFCPICAAPNTLIATPSGEREIASLALGDLVYSVNHGAIEAVPVVRLGSTPVSRHRVMRVTLDSGAVLEISQGHPTADGRLFGELQSDQLLDAQRRIVEARLVPFAYDRTYDILPGSDTGTYFASGALIGSTLRTDFDEMSNVCFHAPVQRAMCAQRRTRCSSYF